MTERNRGAMLGVLAVALLYGCGHSHSIVGSWDIKGGPGPATITFQPDGNYKTQATMPGRQSSTFGPYRLEGDTLTLQTPQPRTASLRWISDDEAVMTGDDGKAMTLARRK
jgi:hypothetical protein